MNYGWRYMTFTGDRNQDFPKKKKCKKKKNWVRDPNIHFAKENIQRPMKRFSMSLISREMQFQTTKKHHLTSVTMAIIKKIRNKNVGKEAEKREPLHTVGGNLN